MSKSTEIPSTEPREEQTSEIDEVEKNSFLKTVEKGKNRKSAARIFQGVADIGKAEIVNRYLAYQIQFGTKEEAGHAERIAQQLIEVSNQNWGNGIPERKINPIIEKRIDSLFKEYEQVREKLEEKIAEKKTTLENWDTSDPKEWERIEKWLEIESDQQMSLAEWLDKSKKLNGPESLYSQTENWRGRLKSANLSLQDFDELSFSFQEVEEGTAMDKIDEIVEKLNEEKSKMIAEQQKILGKIKKIFGIPSKDTDTLEGKVSSLEDLRTIISRLQDTYKARTKKVNDGNKKNEETQMERKIQKAQLEDDLKETEIAYKKFQKIEKGKETE